MTSKRNEINTMQVEILREYEFFFNQWCSEEVLAVRSFVRREVRVSEENYDK